MRIFLDANILFSAAKSAGAIRHLLLNLGSNGQNFIVDEYVTTEARRNLSNKANQDAIQYFETLLLQLEVNPVQHQLRRAGSTAKESTEWLPEKDRPVLLAAIALKCDALVTGDRTHFGAGYGKTFGGVTIYSPAQLAQALFAKPQI